MDRKIFEKVLGILGLVLALWESVLGLLPWFKNKADIPIVSSQSDQVIKNLQPTDKSFNFSDIRSQSSYLEIKSQPDNSNIVVEAFNEVAIPQIRIVTTSVVGTIETSLGIGIHLTPAVIETDFQV